MAVLLAAALWSTQSFAAPEPRVFDTIDVRNNSRFRDGDILSTAGIAPGQRLSQADLETAVQALDHTGEFDSIDITSNGRTLIITVDEAPAHSGELSFGLGYTSADGLFGLAQLRLTDLMQGNGAIYGRALVAAETTQVSAAFERTNLVRQGLTGGLRFSYEDYRYSDVLYHYSLTEVEPYLRWSLGAADVELRLTHQRDSIHTIDPTASPILQADAGKRRDLGAGLSLIAGASDRWSLRLDQDVLGLDGGAIATTRLTANARTPLGRSGFALRSSFEAGHTWGLGDGTPRVSDRFSLGGNQLRGFARGTVGPRDVCTGCGAGGADVVTPLGGTSYAVLRTDLILPLSTERLPNLETFAFVDIGSSWSVDTDIAPAGTLDDDRHWRRSTGLGASLDLTIGRLEAYVALDSQGEALDETEIFGLTFRSSF